MNLLDRIRKINRALTELTAGILAYGVLCQAVGVFIVKDRLIYSAGLWMGIALALFAAVHMWYTIDRALDLGEGGAPKALIAANMIRYGVVVAAIILMAVTGIGDALAGFLGVMGLKVSAYFQPFTHKISNRIFRETDPIPQPLAEEQVKEEEEEIKPIR